MQSNQTAQPVGESGLSFEQGEIEQSIVARWRRVVTRYPDAAAVSDFEGRQISYRALDEASDAIAEGIVARCGVENHPITLLLDHAPPLITAILGVLKANKAYAVLDVHSSEGQLRLLCEETDAPLIITDDHHAPLAARIAGPTQPIALLGSLPATPAGSALPAPSALSLAGIFFTSGSTSRAKGVPRMHCTVLHRSWSDVTTYRFGPGSRISGIRHCGLGGGMADLFNALLSGACYCMYEVRTQGVQQLSDYLRAQRITYFHPSISLLRQWLDTLDPDDRFPDLRYTLPSGRKTRADLERLWPHLPADGVIITSYSCTEVTRISTALLSRADELPEGQLHVGRPGNDVQVEIRSEDGALLPPGETGEIVVRKRYIAAGYWRQTPEAAQRFTAEADGVVRYRTGDFGYFRPDGTLMLVGRRDSQVKLRGYRVVLSVIEDELRRLPDIAEAVVRVHPEQEKLVAYVTTHDGAQLNAITLRTTLAERLPTYAIPSTFIRLANMPLLASGKVDLHRLPPPDGGRPEYAADLTPPADAIEHALIAIWEELLNIAPIGVADSFVDLGGHSLLLARLQLAIAERFGRTVSMAHLLQLETIAALARYLQALPAEQSADPLAVAPPLVPGLTPEQQTGFELLYRSLDDFDEVKAVKLAVRTGEYSRIKVARLALFGAASRRLSLDAIAAIGRWAARNPALRRTYWARHVRRVERFYAAIACAVDIETVIRRRLFTAYFVNRFAGMSADQLAAVRERLTIRGEEQLTDRPAGRGVLLLRSHEASRIFYTFTQPADYRVGNARTLMKYTSYWDSNVEKLLHGRQLELSAETLRRGGIVEMHADGREGSSRGIPQEIFGAVHPIFTGFAELALMTGALVIPVYGDITTDGGGVMTYGKPFDPPSLAASREQQIAQLVAQYAAVLRHIYGTTPWMVDDDQMRWQVAGLTTPFA